MGRRDKGSKVDGWLVLDKPVGMTSTEAVARVKRLFDAQKAGHAGTLDPLASGSLPIALGEATKTVAYAMDGRKLYRFTIGWGAETTTDDLEGPRRGDLRQAPGRGGDPRGPAGIHRRDHAGPAALLRHQDRRRARLRPRPRGRGRRARAARDRRSTGSSSSNAPTPTTPCSSPNAARAPTSGRWRATWAGGSARAAMSWRSAGWPSGRSARRDMISLEKLEELRHNAGASGGLGAEEALLSVATALDDIPALAMTERDAVRLKRGQAVILRGRDAPVTVRPCLCDLRRFAHRARRGRSGRFQSQACVQPVRRPKRPGTRIEE